jgi:hypothetical protein
MNFAFDIFPMTLAHSLHVALTLMECSGCELIVSQFLD